MDNTLKRQLKGTVTNAGLEGLGEISFLTKNRFRINCKKQIVVSCDNAVLSLTENGTGVTSLSISPDISSTIIYIVGTSNWQKVSISDKYSVSNIAFFALNSNFDFSYMNALKIINNYETVGNGMFVGTINNNIETLVCGFNNYMHLEGTYPNLKIIEITKPNALEMTTAELITKFPALTTLCLEKDHVTGTFDDLGKIATLATIQGIVNIEGSVEGFVAQRKIATGSDTGSVVYKWGSRLVSYDNGSHHLGYAINNISWTATTITVNDYTYNI